MLINETVRKMNAMKLFGMAKAYEELKVLTINNELSVDEVIGSLIDREQIDRDNRATKRRLNTAKLREQALVEDIDWQHPRKLDKSKLKPLISNEWIRHHQNIVFVGPTGLGKTWLTCALAQKACQDGFSTKYFRIPRLLGQLNMARGDGSYERFLRGLAKTQLIILDDWGQTLSEQERRDIREIIEERFDRGSIIITTQVPINRWHELIGDPTIADAIVDRIANKAHIFSLDGDSMRKKKTKEIKKEINNEDGLK